MSDRNLNLEYGSVWRDPKDGEIVMFVADQGGWQYALVLIKSDNSLADSTEGTVTGRTITYTWERLA